MQGLHFTGRRRRLAAMSLAGPKLIDQVDAWLPQIQCRRCGYAGCYPYAQAVVNGNADINRCPPGGEVTIRALAQLLGRPVIPLDPSLPEPGGRVSARVEEKDCIGCTLCLRACPVDAIVGARKHLHTVLAQTCTGCGLCLPPCPTDCIELVPHPAPRTGPWPDFSLEEAHEARRRWRAREARLARKTTPSTPAAKPNPDRDAIRAEIQAAVERVRRRKGTQGLLQNKTDAVE